MKKLKHVINFDLLKFLKSKNKKVDTAPYYLASKESLEAAAVNHTFKNYFYTIGLYYGEGATIKIDNTTYELKRGSLLTIGRGAVCQWINTTFPLNDTLFFYDDVLANNFSNSLFYSLEFFCPDEHCVIQLTGRHFTEMQQLFRALRAVEDKPDVVSGVLYSILAITQKHFWKLYRGGKRELSEKDQAVIRFRELVANNFSEHKNVAFYADKLNVSSKYLSEILVDQTGLSAKKWIEFHIMHEAKYLLSFLDLSVKEVALRLGYIDTSHFSRAFKSYDGQLPSEFKTVVRELEFIPA